ncbi:MAG: sodium-dependent transporter [Thermoguttaceae bacterium]
MKKKENWQTHFGMVLAVIGSAVGLGNFLRFPGQAALCGGGPFMLPYFLSLLILGLPLAWVEWTLGRFGGKHGYNSVPGILYCSVKSRTAAYFGTLGVAVPFLIFAYYILIEGWCLIYAIRYAQGLMNLGSQAEYGTLFADTVGIVANGSALKNPWTSPIILCTLFCFCFNFFLIYRGISKGIEWFCKWALPALFLCSLIILLRVATLGNPTGEVGQSFWDGLIFMWNPIRPDETIWETYSNPQLWLAASGQVFFSLSVGFGLIITYASYAKAEDDVARAGLTAVFGNSFCEVVFGGMMIVPAAIMFLGPTALNKETLGSSFTLGFQTLPSVFEQMHFGQFFGFMFFFLLFLAAVTSSISMLQPSIALLQEGLGLGRKRSVLLLASLMSVAALFVLYFSENLLAMDTIDFWTANFFVCLMGAAQIFFFSWIFGVERGMDELRQGASFHVPAFIGFIKKYVTPLFMLLILLCSIYQSMFERLVQIISNETVLLSVGVILLFNLFFLIVTHYSLKRWEKREQNEPPHNERA